MMVSLNFHGKFVTQIRFFYSTRKTHSTETINRRLSVTEFESKWTPVEMENTTSVLLNRTLTFLSVLANPHCVYKISVVYPIN